MEREGNSMRKKFLIGIVVFLCMAYLAGCQKNSLKDTAQTDAAVNQGGLLHEESDTAELVRNNSEESVTARQELPEEMNAVESTADNQFMEVIDRSRIDDQSFEVVLNEWGNVTFVSCMPDFYDENLDPLTDASFYLLKNGKVFYQFPYVSDNNIRETGLCEGVSFVFFEDINEDNKDEIVIGVLYVSGAGPQGMIPYTEIRIYEDGGNEFVYNGNLSDEINEKLAGEVTAEYVKTLLKDTGYSILTYTEAPDRNSRVSIQYPFFEGEGKGTLNDLIFAKVQEFAQTDGSLFPEDSGLTINYQAEITLQNAKIVSIVFWGTSSISGGAYETDDLIPFNIDLRTMEEVSFEDLYAANADFQKVFFDKAYFPTGPVTSCDEGSFAEMLKLQSPEYQSVSPFSIPGNVRCFLKPDALVLSMPSVHAAGSDHFEAQINYDDFEEFYLLEQKYWD